jgi:hypothetical protein
MLNMTHNDRMLNAEIRVKNIPALARAFTSHQREILAKYYEFRYKRPRMRNGCTENKMENFKLSPSQELQKAVDLDRRYLFWQVGTGKTCGAVCAIRDGEHVLWVTKMRLKGPTRENIRRCPYKPNANIKIISYRQYVNIIRKKGKLGSKIGEYNHVIVDEVHNILQNDEIVDQLKREPKITLLTATPQNIMKIIDILGNDWWKSISYVSYDNNYTIYPKLKFHFVNDKGLSKEFIKKLGECRSDTHAET